MGQRTIGVLGFERKISIRVSIFALLALLVLAFGILYTASTTNSERSDLEFIAIAITAAASIASGFYLAESLREQSEQQKEAEAFALVARWNSPDMSRARRSWLKISETFQAQASAGGGPEGVKKLLLDPAEVYTNHNIRYVLNFLEEIAMAVKHSHADGELLISFFQSIVLRAHAALASWIPEHRKATGRDDIWDQFDLLCNQWHK